MRHVCVKWSTMHTANNAQVSEIFSCLHFVFSLLLVIFALMMKSCGCPSDSSRGEEGHIKRNEDRERKRERVSETSQVVFALQIYTLILVHSAEGRKMKVFTRAREWA